MRNKVIRSSEGRFENDVRKSTLPTMVYFYSDECPPCNYFGPLFEKLAEKYAGKMKFIKIHRQQNRQLAEELNIKSSPTVLFFKHGEEICSRLNGYIKKTEIDNEIENVIGGICQTKEREKVFCDLLIVGGGPAGLSAAIFAARARLHTVVLDAGLAGGQVSTTFHVANYPGTNGVVRGMDLMQNMKNQAIEFGTQIEELAEISEINLEGEQKHVAALDADYYAKALIVATGAEPRKLPAEGEEEFRGRGVHYCATCDGAMYHDANILVIGGGDSAVEEAVFLTRYAKHVTIVHRAEYFQASKAAQDEALKNPNISIIRDSQVAKIMGENFVKSALIENIKTGDSREIETDGIFVYIGMEPKTEIFQGKVNMDEHGYIITDQDMGVGIPGIFAVGDVRKKKIRQIATAVGDGAIAGITAERFINGRMWDY
ncbi:MAG: thioredoxin-disulfide reductase [Clostridium sp.]|nr:thioredoxin-disulfide reductase [Clostridium sp.]